MNDFWNGIESFGGQCMFNDNRDQEHREELWAKLYEVVATLKDTMDDMYEQDNYSFNNVLEHVSKIKNLDVHIRNFDARTLPEQG